MSSRYYSGGLEGNETMVHSVMEGESEERMICKGKRRVRKSMVMNERIC